MACLLMQQACLLMQQACLLMQHGLSSHAAGLSSHAAWPVFSCSMACLLMQQAAGFLFVSDTTCQVADSGEARHYSCYDMTVPCDSVVLWVCSVQWRSSCLRLSGSRPALPLRLSGSRPALPLVSQAVWF